MPKRSAWHLATWIEIVALIGAGLSFFLLEPPVSGILMAVFLLVGMALAFAVERY